jgi:hypothetical protein
MLRVGYYQPRTVRQRGIDFEIPMLPLPLFAVMRIQSPLFVALIVPQAAICIKEHQQPTLGEGGSLLQDFSNFQSPTGWTMELSLLLFVSGGVLQQKPLESGAIFPAGGLLLVARLRAGKTFALHAKSTCFS